MNAFDHGYLVCAVVRGWERGSDTEVEWDFGFGTEVEWDFGFGNDHVGRPWYHRIEAACRTCHHRFDVCHTHRNRGDLCRLSAERNNDHRDDHSAYHLGASHVGRRSSHCLGDCYLGVCYLSACCPSVCFLSAGHVGHRGGSGRGCRCGADSKAPGTAVEEEASEQLHLDQQGLLPWTLRSALDTVPKTRACVL